MIHQKHNQDESCPGCESRIKDACSEIREFFYFVKARYPEVHCSWVYRGEKEQEEAYKSGASKAKFGQSKHNIVPAQAIDIFQIDDTGRAIFNGIFCAKINKEAHDAGFKLKWGGNFKSLGDSGHFEC